MGDLDCQLLLSHLVEVYVFHWILVYTVCFLQLFLVFISSQQPGMNLMFLENVELYIINLISNTHDREFNGCGIFA